MLALCLAVPVGAQEGVQSPRATPPRAGVVTPVPDILTGSDQAAVRVWGVGLTAQPYAVAYLVTQNRTGKYVSALQLKWLLFDPETGKVLEEGRATARRLPVSIVKSLQEGSQLEDFVAFVGTSDYGLPLEPFRKKYPDRLVKLVFVAEQDQLPGGETWSREIVPTFPDEEVSSCQAVQPQGKVTPLCDTLGKISFCEDW